MPPDMLARKCIVVYKMPMGGKAANLRQDRYAHLISIGSFSYRDFSRLCTISSASWSNSSHAAE